jgi:hypothetical protein
MQSPAKPLYQMIQRISNTKVLHLPELSKVKKTPYKYNGGQLYATGKKAVKYTINSDWCELTARGVIVPGYVEDPPRELTFENGSIRLELARNGRGTQHYKFVYDVYTDEDPEPFALLLTAPRPGGVLHDGFNQLRVLNYQLYREGWTAKLNRAIRGLGLTLNNVTRLDIAMDGHGFFEFFQKFSRGQYDRVGKGKYSTHNEGNRELTGFDWGGKTSDKHITCYNKTKRIETENKAYVRDFWELNGLSIEKDVERLELKIRAKAIKKIADPETGELGVDLARLEDAQYLSGIFRAQCKNYFEFTLPSNDTNVTRRDRISPIDWEAFDGVQMQRLPTTKAPNEKWRAKISAAKILEDGKKLSYLEDALRTYFESCNHYHVPDEVIRGIPEIVAYAMAGEHGCAEWLDKRMGTPPGRLIDLKAAV